MREDLFAQTGNTAERKKEYNENLLSLLKMKKTINIAVSGDVMLTSLETQIVDTNEFQRLRRLRQLGTTYLVFPTAIHTRFDHSLGTLKISEDIFNAIQNNQHNIGNQKLSDPIEIKESRILLRLYALLHDITHIPFGHTLEDQFHIFSRHDKSRKRLDHFIGPNSIIGKLIRNHLKKNIGNEILYWRFLNIYLLRQDNVRYDKDLNKELYSSFKQNDAFIHYLVSNTACADLLDYLQRDAFFCNVSINTSFRFINYMFLTTDPETKFRIPVIRLAKVDTSDVIRLDLLSELVGLLESRYRMVERVYFHHAKLIADSMLAYCVYLSIKREGLKEEDLYEKGDEELLMFLAFGDVGNKSRKKDATVSRIALNLINRKLHKMKGKITISEVKSLQESDKQSSDIKKNISKMSNNMEYRFSLEREIADQLGIDEGSVIFYCPDYKMNSKLAKMYVWVMGSPVHFEDAEKSEAYNKRLEAINISYLNLWNVCIYMSNKYLESLEGDNYRLPLGISKNLFYSKVLNPGPKKEDIISKYYKEVLYHRPKLQKYREEASSIKFESAITEAVKELVADTSGYRSGEDLDNCVISYLKET